MAPLRMTFFGILMLAMFLAIIFRLSVPTRMSMFQDSSGNETGAMATLRNLASCEAQVQDSKKIDVDGDGIGEYGFLGEMTAAAGVRADPRGDKRGAKIEPPILSAALARVEASGFVSKAGYLFRIHLPGAGGSAISEGLPGAPLSGPVDTDAAEKQWCAYAWPVTCGSGGTRALFVNQAGDIWQSANETTKYSIAGRTPAWNAALPPGAGWGASPRPDTPATDGEVWTLVK